MELTDLVIIVLYLVGITIWGIVSGGKQKSSHDYFLGARTIPWPAVTFSIVAAETSTLTFISIPGLAYLTNLNFLQLTIGYLAGRIIVALYFLPRYYEGKLETAYTFLGSRFGNKTRLMAAVVFLVTRVAADGVRLFATAIPLKLLLGINYELSIIIIAVVALVYTSFGGVRGVIWVDVVQMFIYLGGAVLAGIFLINNLIPGGLTEVLQTAGTIGKFEVFNFSVSNFFNDPYTVWGSLIGGCFLSMASHGTDQLIVQRLLTLKKLAASRKALVASGIIIIFQFGLFLVIGLLLFTYYQGANFSTLGISKADELFPLFIIKELPVGLSGLIIAGLFAAALSTIAGSMSSLSSSLMLDIIRPFKLIKKSANELRISRLVTIGWAIVLSFSAMFFITTSQTVVELALSIASFTYGGLLGTFILGLLVKGATEKDAIPAFILSIIIMTLIILTKTIAWTWFTFIGVLLTLAVGYTFTLIRKGKPG